MVDPTLADSLQHLNKYIELFESNSDIHNVTVDGARVEDLALFLIPGNPDYELILMVVIPSLLPITWSFISIK